MAQEKHFVIGVDLDGVVADFYGYMREMVAEWRGVAVSSLTDTGYRWGLAQWGLRDIEEYNAVHRWAVSQKDMFANVGLVHGAAATLRNLSRDGCRIRIITHRLVVPYLHQVSVAQTVQWLDRHDVPYWDLCFMREKGEVGADVYVEDGPKNIERLREAKKDVIIFDNSTNHHLDDEPGGRVVDWENANKLIRDRYDDWKSRHSA